MSATNHSNAFNPGLGVVHSQSLENSPKSIRKIDLTTKQEEDFGNSESIAKDTGLLWLYDAVSPTDDKKEVFFSQVPPTSSQTEDFNDIEYSMDHLSIDSKPKHYSSSSLQPFGNPHEQNFQVPRYQHYSSQALNVYPIKEESYDPWPLTSISTIPPNLPLSVFFDFEINDDFKLNQVQSSYFVDMDTNEVVYFCPLAEQLVLYNYNCYIKCTLFLPPLAPSMMHIQEKLYYGYANLFDLREYTGK